MSTMNLTLIGIENFLNYQDDSLFSNITLPTGIDKDILVENILVQSAEFEVLYSNADFLKEVINHFFEKYNKTFTKWITALNIEYNPLENYDRQESWSDYHNGSSNASGSSNSSNNSSGSGENKVSAFDSISYQPESSTSSSMNQSTQTNDSSNSTNSATDNHSGRIHGNIGITTSQQMLQAELEVAMWNIYNHITDLFIQEFCLAVY